MNGQSTAYLARFLNYETQSLLKSSTIFNLNRIQHLLAQLNHPERKYPIIHVVGTKGKGSTSIFISSMLRAAGLRVGLYTSPHLYNYTERIRVLTPGDSFEKRKNIFYGKISPQQLEKVLNEIKPKIEKIEREKVLGSLTFFEVYTAIAFYFFAQQQVDVVVAEAGLGGRFDATNTGASDICVFTPISYDHTQVLGDTLKKIAREKAAIIKPSTRMVFSAPQNPEACAQIESEAKKFALNVARVGCEIRYKIISQNLLGVIFRLWGIYHRWPRLQSHLLGEHQVINASLAAAVVEYFLGEKNKLAKSAIVKGAAQARWPARFEIVSKKPCVVIDSAHNKDSAQRLAQAVVQNFPRKKIIVLLGISRDKDIEGILQQLVPISRKVILTSSRHPRSFDFFKEKEKFLRIKEVCITQEAKEGFRLAKKEAGARDVIVVAGSVFLAAEIRKLCKAKI